MELKPGYKQTEVGVIPVDWDVKRLGEIARFRTGPFGSALHKQDYTDNGIPIVNPMHIVDSAIVPTYEMTIAAERATELADFRLRQGDIVIGRRGEMGRCAVVAAAQDGWLCGTGSMIVRANQGYSAEFLQLILSSEPVIASIENASVGSTMINLNQGVLNGLKVALPSNIEEQQAIATCVNAVGSQVEAFQILITKKRQIKQAAMQELLTGKRRLPGFEGEWEEFSLGSVASMNSGGTPPTGRDDYYGGGIPWVSISDMTSGGKFISQTERTLSAAGLANCAAKQFPAGTILYAMYASLGECSIAATEVTSSQAILGIRPGASLHNEFLFYYLSSIHDKVKLMGQQGTQSNLNKGIVQGFTLRLPGKAEQIAIAEALGEIDQELDALSMKAQKIREMKAGMMQQLLTGKIRLI